MNLLGIGIVYLIVITGWIGYHKSISVKRETGDWGTVRFVFDLFIVFIVYNLLLVANPNSKEYYSSVFIYLIPIIYTLYVILDFAKLQELKDALQVKRVNDELLEYLSSSLNWLLRYSHKYQIPLPEKDRIIEMLENIMNVDKKLPPNFKHPNGTPKDSTEPIFTFLQYINSNYQ